MYVVVSLSLHLFNVQRPFCRRTYIDTKVLKNFQLTAKEVHTSKKEKGGFLRHKIHITHNANQIMKIRVS